MPCEIEHQTCYERGNEIHTDCGSLCKGVHCKVDTLCGKFVLMKPFQTCKTIHHGLGSEYYDIEGQTARACARDER